MCSSTRQGIGRKRRGSVPLGIPLGLHIPLDAGVGQSAGVSPSTEQVSGFCLERGDSLPDPVLPWGVFSDEDDGNPREPSDPLLTQIVSEIIVRLFSFLEARDTGTLKGRIMGLFRAGLQTAA